MGPNDGTIDGMEVPIELSGGIALLLQGLQDALPDPRLLPAIKAAGDRVPGAVALGQISPRCSSSQDPQDPIDDQAMIFGWTACFWLLRRKQGEPISPIGRRLVLLFSYFQFYIGFANTP